MNARLIVMVLIVMTAACEEPKQQPEASSSVVLVDSLSGLVIDENFDLVRSQCTACHSAKMITQSSASREGWEQMIRWMQKDQGLWDLGDNEPLILDYLSLHYGIKKKGRRTPLTNIEWYTMPDKQ